MTTGKAVKKAIISKAEKNQMLAADRAAALEIGVIKYIQAKTLTGKIAIAFSILTERWA